MPAKAKPASKKPTSPRENDPVLRDEVEAVMESLRRLASKAVLEGMARYGIPSDHALGVSVANMQKLAKSLGKNHELAAALWETGVYEARFLTSFVDDPSQVTSKQMDQWCLAFDNWAICDTLCFHLFDRTPFAFAKVQQWASHSGEFVKRTSFALLACLALHDKTAADKRFQDGLALCEQAADDERNFVKKGVSWAVRAIGRRNADLHALAIDLSLRLVESSSATARWIGKDALKDLQKAAVINKLSAKKPPATKATARKKSPKGSS